MGDSDEEYGDRRRGRDKFRRERNDYENRERRGGGGGHWEDRGQHGDGWGNRERRDSYQDFGERRRRFSPPRHDMSPPQMKRMRRDWDESGGGGGRFQHFDQGYGGGGGMHGGGGQGGGGWGNDRPQGHFNSNQPPRSMGDTEYPTQPALMSFKQFLSSQDDSITDDEAIKKFNEYKLDFKKQQLEEFFKSHKEEEWFKAKYHPEECDKRHEEQKTMLVRRRDIFVRLLEMGRVEACSLDISAAGDIIKLLDAAVILMEGGTELDLKVLDEEPLVEGPDRPNAPNRRVSESQSEVKSAGGGGLKVTIDNEENGELEEGEEEEEPPAAEKPREFSSDSDSLSSSDSENESRNPDDDDEEGGEGEAGRKYRRKKMSKKDKETINQAVKEETTPAEPEETPKQEEEETNKSDTEEGGAKSEEAEAPPTKEEPEEEEGEPKPQAHHRTNSIFLRNLAPAITKQEVEAMCKRYPGFLRVALQDPQPERKFLRRGWVTFDRTVNIKDICWNLNNIRLRDCEMGAIVNRELKQRVRPVSGVTADRQVAKADIKHLARIIRNFDRRWNLWDEDGVEKDSEKDSLTLGLQSNNPIMPKNITDYLVDEGSYEEEEYLGSLIDDNKDKDEEVNVNRDEELLKVIDKMILYLRIVHSFDYYSSIEYPNEDEMPHKCGIMHVRGPKPPNRLHPNEVSDWMGSFEMKVSSFVKLKVTVSDREQEKLGKKNTDVEVEKFIQTNTQELAKDKWLCPLSGKKFKGPEFVRKHILNKHAEKVEEFKQEVAYFNNYLKDPKRPMLPEHPSNRSGMGMMMPPPQRETGGYVPRGGFHHHNQRGNMGYQRPPMYGQRGPYHNQGGYQNRRPDFRQHERRETFPSGPRRDRERQDPRGIVEYRDLDAPEDNDF